MLLLCSNESLCIITIEWSIMNFKKTLLFLGGLSIFSFTCVIFSDYAASFSKYAPKLLQFEGEGFGIHQPIWGEKEYTKEEALAIHRHYYWNVHKGNLFKNQQVAEVFIDHIINAGVGKNRENVKAFERIIGVKPNGYITAEDVNIANSFEFPHEIVNAYVDYRLAYYKTRKNWRQNRGWFVRAKSFYMPIPDNYYEQHDELLAEQENQTNDWYPNDSPEENFERNTAAKPTEQSLERTVYPSGMVIEEYIIEPK